LRVLEGRPLVTLKLARTADGYCAPAGGGRLQISGEQAMHEVHLMRASHDAIMVGVGTVLSDDPQLTVRLPGLENRSPVRVVLDSNLRTPLRSALLRGAAEVPLWVVAAEDAPSEPERGLRLAGAEVMRVARRGDGTLDVGAALRLLALRGITRVFSEGGPRIADALIAARLADTVIISTADNALGAPGMIALLPPVEAALADPARFSRVAESRHGDDVFTTYERVG
jgi:diaminohydroxyphosphoribosylaminopyrimidine deaminase/5-amino-6-(5-phosphoribosylamino)uracil reductase